MNYHAQVDRAHYEGKAYASQERWNSYWHQIDIVRALEPRTLLEVGVGKGVVARELAAAGVGVTTLDIAEDLHPDVVGSITELPFGDKTFDAVLAAEVLEHIRFDDVPKALAEVRRVARRHAVISLPHPGYVFSLRGKIPLLPYLSAFFKVPFFWKTHVFNGEHYWELGKRGYSLHTFLDSAKKAGLKPVFSKAYADDPAHRFFVFEVL